LACGCFLGVGYSRPPTMTNPGIEADAQTVINQQLLKNTTYRVALLLRSARIQQFRKYTSTRVGDTAIGCCVTRDGGQPGFLHIIVAAPGLDLCELFPFCIV